MQNGLKETAKPIIKAQEETKKTIDEKQDQLLEQLDKNQKALASNLEDIGILQYVYDKQEKTSKLPIDYKPNRGFTTNELNLITDHGFSAPSEIWNRYVDNKLDIDDYDEEIGLKLQELGRKKEYLSRTKAQKTKIFDEINKLTDEIKLIQKYRKRIQSFTEAKKTIGQGLKYTRPKTNASKIQQNGQYGGLMIDLPKLFGQLRLVASKKGKKVLGQQADFDTIDLLTKRYNSTKNYSSLSRMLFDQLNKLSEIQYIDQVKNITKLVQVLFITIGFNCIIAGNNGVQSEFSQIAHTLNKLGAINNKQLSELLKEYVI